MEWSSKKMMNEEKWKMKEQGSRVKTQKGQSRAKKEVSKTKTKTHCQKCQKLKCSIQGVLKAFENL